MRTAVTGGSGFIGSHVVDRLVAAGHDVVVIDESVRRLNPAAEYVEADVLDVGALSEALAGCGAVLHLAAMSNVDAAARHPLTAVRVNVGGTTAVLEVARRCEVERFVLASTVWVYGAAADDGNGELSEDVAVRLDAPGHLYTASKMAAEMVVQSYRELYGQRFTILRYGIPYGPRMRDELVIARFVQRALAGEPLTIAGDGRQVRNYVYVEDLADAHARALAPEGADEVFALDGAEAVGIRDIVETVRELVGDVAVQRVPARPGDYAGRAVSTAKAERLLGWRATTPFREGVRRYLEWHRAQPEDALAVARAN